MQLTTRFILVACLSARFALAQATPPEPPGNTRRGVASPPVDDAAFTPDPSPAPAGRVADPAAALVPPPAAEEDVFSELERELSEPHANSAAPAGTAAPPGGSRGAQSMNPDLALIADFAAAWFSDADHQQTGGHDPTRTGFNLQGLELNARSVVDPYLRFDASVVFAEEEVEIEEVYATSLALPGGLQARFGQFLTRFGRINPTHPHAWDFSDQPFAIGRAFGGEGNRGLGLELSWLLPLPWYVELVGSATEASGAGSNRSFRGESELGVEGPGDLLGVVAVKQFFDLDRDWSLLWGVSGAFGPGPTDREHRSAVYGTDLYLKYRPLVGADSTVVTWQTEMLHRRRQIGGQLLWDSGGYSQINVRFARRWSSGIRYELGSPAYDLSAHVADDPLDPEWTRTRHRGSAALTHHPTEFSRFRLQGSRDTGGAAEGIWAVFLAAELVVGAHGAHSF